MGEPGAEPMLLRTREWDSAFFGLRIAAVVPDRLGAEELAAIEQQRTAEAIDCLYFLAAPEDPATLRRVAEARWRFVDVRLTLARELAGAAANEDPSIRRAEAADVGALRALARASHHDSRFYQDGRFARELCDRLFEEWIEKSVRGALADVVLVSGAVGVPLAYVTLSAPAGREATIGLLAVDPRAQGQGLGGRLLDAALDEARRRGAAGISVVTQGANVRAQRAYQRAGFLARQAGYWYHAWR